MPLLRWLFSTEMGCPGPHGHWPAWLAVLFHSSNLIIAFADLAIPAVILANWKYRRDGIRAAAVWTVLLYFPVKAASRLVRVLEVGGAPYHLAAILDALTAALAVYSACQLGPFLRHVMRLPSRDEVHALNNRLNAELLEKHDRNERLLAEIEAAHHALAADVWLGDKHAALDRIAAIVREGR